MSLVIKLKPIYKDLIVNIQRNRFLRLKEKFTPACRPQLVRLGLTLASRVRSTGLNPREGLNFTVVDRVVERKISKQLN